MIDQAALDEVFPVNPLREVAFEIRFPTNFRVLPDIYVAQRQFKSEYPLATREEGFLPTGAAVTNYQFSTPGKDRVIKIWEDRFAIIFPKYDTFESFKKEVLERTNLFCEEFQIDQLSRVGLRYVNNIAGKADDPINSLSESVIPYIQLDQFDTGQIKQFGTQIVLQRKDCTLAVRTAYIQQEPQQDWVYLLDFDAYLEQTLALSGLNESIELFHYNIQIEFLNRITDRYKQEMRGGK